MGGHQRQAEIRSCGAVCVSSQGEDFRVYSEVLTLEKLKVFEQRRNSM